MGHHNIRIVGDQLREILAPQPYDKAVATCHLIAIKNGNRKHLDNTVIFREKLTHCLVGVQKPFFVLGVR